ncbi:hypothetical protein FRB98_001898 [Tulasnella sp. 332]|nr:hypothetical protein FRB98_001898 [Tulasnella sp. 332]
MQPSNLAEKALDLILRGEVATTSSDLQSRVLALDASEIDEHIFEIHLALEKLSKEASGRIVRLRQRRNTFATIHKLPIELIVRIFTQALEMDEHEWSGLAYYPRLHDLAQVATEWSRIVKNFPDFWAVIDTGIEHSLVKAALARSKDLPITVISRDVGFRDDNAGWSTVSRHIRRWNAAEITSNQTNNIYDLEDFLKHGIYEHGGAASLKRVKIKLDPDHTFMVPVVFGEDLPHLRRIELGGIIFMAWGPTLLGHLDWLSLENIGATEDMPLTVEQTLDLLRDCKQLTYFRLSNVLFNDQTLRTTPSSIGLDSLIELNLEGLHTRATYHILASVRLPRCATYRICPSTTQDISEILEVLAICATRTLASALENADYLSLEVSDDKSWYTRETQKEALQLRVRPRTSQSEKGFSLELGGPFAIGLIDWLTNESFQSFLDSTSIDLGFCGQSLEVSEVDILYILERLPSVTFLKLVNLSHDIDDILLRFCNPQLAEPGPFQWLLPNLRILGIHETALSESLLLEMVRQRARGKPARIEYGLPAPATLHRLSLWPTTRDIHHKFLKITEADVLKFWDKEGLLIESNAAGFRTSESEAEGSND